MKMGVVAPRIETCYPQIGCRGRYLFGGIAPRKKLTTAACMHHELLLLFQEARGTNYKQQGCHYPMKKEETWKQFSKGAVESMSTNPSLLLAYWLASPMARRKKTIKTFSTMTSDLEALKDWIEAEGCTHAAIESTAVYWRPVFNILEHTLTVILANAREIKNVPGRKTDVKDCEWIADLLRFGLIRASFIPPKPIRELRDLTRYRVKLTQQMGSEKNRVQKVLEDANIKLSSVATDVFGASGREMLSALLEGESTPEEMAKLAKGKLRKKIPALVEALRGNVSEHHRYLLEMSLRHFEYLVELISELDERVDKAMEPYQEERDLLISITGVEKRTAECIIAEMGVDMSQFPSEGHLSSWAGACPGNNKSAGKRKGGKTTKGDTWLKSILVQAAHAASKTKNSYLKDKYHRIAGRRGKKRAAVAIAHKILIFAYHSPPQKVL
ncbi:IS110 family transposase [Dehalococcoidia bacterium]|nr:IS110 family transposase [Dehalococcoidia bacterium]